MLFGFRSGRSRGNAESPASPVGIFAMGSDSASLEAANALETAVGVKGGEAGGGEGLKATLEVGAYFGLWYALNIGYNVYNKKVLNAVPLPWTLATIQLFAVSRFTRREIDASHWKQMAGRQGRQQAEQDRTGHVRINRTDFTRKPIE